MNKLKYINTNILDSLNHKLISYANKINEKDKRNIRNI